MSQSIHWGIIGLGGIAHTFAEDLVKVKQAKLQAVASRTLEKAQLFKTQFRAEQAYGSYNELIEDPEVEVIYIATPHAFHFEIAMQCLKHKKHVLCEKPMCLNAQQTKKLIEEAKLQNCFLMEAIWTRFMPATKKLLELLEEKHFGELISIVADFGFKSHFNPDGRLFKKSLGGGSLLDVGIYPVFLSLLCLGKPSKILAMARQSPTEVDSSCSMLFDYKTGAKAVLQSSFEMNTPTEAFIYGTKGSIKLHSRFHHSQVIEVFDEVGNSAEIFQLPYQHNGYTHEILEVNRCISKNLTQSELLPLEFSLSLAEVLDQVKAEIDLKY